MLSASKVIPHSDTKDLKITNDLLGFPLYFFTKKKLLLQRVLPEVNKVTRHYSMLYAVYCCIVKPLPHIERVIN